MIARGRGTVVSPPKIEVDLLTLGGFTATMESYGFRLRTTVSAQELVPAGEDVAAALLIPAGEMVVHHGR